MGISCSFVFLLISLFMPILATKIQLIHHQNRVLQNNTIIQSKSTKGVFWVNVSIGQPPIPQLLVMDMGGSLTWVGHKFDPKNSSSYSIVPCNSTTQYCINFYTSKCIEMKSPCTYTIDDEDYRRECILGFDRFTFMSSSGGISQVPNVLFGIESDSDENAPASNGVLGLQAEEYSLISQVEYQFSYCIGNLSDPDYPFHQLLLGNSAIFQGNSTPLYVDQDHYLVSIQGISIGQTRLVVDKYKFRYNVVFESVSMFTTLPQNEFDQLKKEVVQRLQLEQVFVQDLLCYKGNLDRDLKGFPVVTLHLAKDADLILDAGGLFMRYNDDTFCMAVKVSTTNFYSIGVNAQQYYNFGFNMNVAKLSLQRTNCEVLVD